MFLAYPQNVYPLGHRYPRPEAEDIYGPRSYRHYPTATGLDYQRTGAHAARAQYLNALEQARQAELEYMESIRRPHSSHLPYGDAYTLPSSPPYSSYYNREAVALERERALNAQLAERRLAQLAHQQEEERLHRALEERRRAAVVAQELRRAQEAALEERCRLEEIRARNERLKQRELLERRRQQHQLLKQNLALKSASPCSAAFSCPVPTSSDVVPITDALNFFIDVLHPVVTGQDNISRTAVPAPVVPSAPVTQQKKESKPEPKPQPQAGTTSQPTNPQQALLNLFGFKGDSEFKQVVDNVFGLFDPSVAHPAPSSSSPATASSSGPSSTSKTKQVPKAQPSVQEALKQRFGAEQDIDFRHVIENVLGLFNPDFDRPTPSTASRPTPPPRPASSSSDKGKAKEVTPPTLERREPTSKDVLDSFNTIENIAASFSALEHDFEFPSQLDFTDASVQSVLQQLTFTARNAPLRFYEQSLTGLLAQLDAVESYGNEEVRHRRKEVVERIERTLEEIEREVEHRARAWRVKRNPAMAVEDVAPNQNAIAKEAASSSSAGSSSAVPQEPLSNSSIAESNDVVAQSDAIQGTSSATASELPDPLEAVTVTDGAKEIALAAKEEQLVMLEEPSAAPNAELEQLSTSQPEPEEPTQSVVFDGSQTSSTHEHTEELLSQADPVSESVSTITPSSPAPTFTQVASTHALTDIAFESSSGEAPPSSPSVVPEHESESTSLSEAPSTPSLPDATVVSDSESEQDSFLLAAPASETSASSKRRPPSVTVEEVPDSDWSEVDA